MAEERVKSELATTNERVRSLEEQLRQSKADYQQSQINLNTTRDSMQKLEIKISELNSQLSNAIMYKEMYERSQKDFEQEQKQNELKLSQRDTEIMDLNDRLHKYEDSEQDFKLQIEGLNEAIKELQDAAKRPASRQSSRERSPSPDTNLDEMLELRK